MNFNEVIEKNKNGVSLHQLAREYNTSFYKIMMELESRKITPVLYSSNKPYECPDIALLKKCVEVDKMKYKDIGKLFDVSSSAISIWCKKHKIKTNSSKKQIPAADLLHDMYIQKELSISEISKSFNASNVTVGKWLDLLGIPKRNRSEDQKLAYPFVALTKRKKYGYENFPLDMPFTKRSKCEIEIEKFLNDNGFNFNPRRDILEGNLELDMFDEDKGIAIEYCGAYYHSELFKKHNYHYEKFKQCKEKGIQLITIFDCDYEHQKDNVKSFLLSKLGKYEQRIAARKCRFEEIKDNSIFNYHLQGKPNMVLKQYGLIYEGECVGSVAYSKHHRQQGKIVLSRLCFKNNIQIIGGANKLIKNSIDEFRTDIISWSDNRFSIGGIYEQMGFEKVREYKPDYFYTNGRTKRSKQSMQKKKIGCPENIKEHDFVRDMGWYRVFDCGKIMWSYGSKLYPI